MKIREWYKTISILIRGTVKNNYLLLLILDIIKNIRTKKIFMKLDLRWDYKDIRIKEDEWKAMLEL